MYLRQTQFLIGLLLTLLAIVIAYFGNSQKLEATNRIQEKLLLEQEGETAEAKKTANEMQLKLLGEQAARIIDKAAEQAARELDKQELISTLNDYKNTLAAIERNTSTSLKHSEDTTAKAVHAVDAATSKPQKTIVEHVTVSEDDQRRGELEREAKKLIRYRRQLGDYRDTLLDAQRKVGLKKRPPKDIPME